MTEVDSIADLSGPKLEAAFAPVGRGAVEMTENQKVPNMAACLE
jgi:hypothetical protein